MRKTLMDFGRIVYNEKKLTEAHKTDSNFW